MPTHTTAQVKAAFRSRQPLSTTNLVSDGTSLWSYGWYEIARWVPDCHCETPDLKCCPNPPSGYKLVIRRNPTRLNKNGTPRAADNPYGGPWFSNTTAHHASGVYPGNGEPWTYATNPTPINQGPMEL